MILNKSTNYRHFVVGLSGSYNLQRELEYLAIATERQVVIIRFNLREEDMKLSKQHDPVAVKANLKKVLNETLGSGAKHKFLAFNAQSLAVGLHLETEVHIKGLIDLQTLVRSKNTAPGSFGAIMTLFRAGGFTEKDRAGLEWAFDDIL